MISGTLRGNLCGDEYAWPAMIKSDVGSTRVGNRARAWVLPSQYQDQKRPPHEAEEPRDVGLRQAEVHRGLIPHAAGDARGRMVATMLPPTTLLLVTATTATAVVVLVNCGQALNPPPGGWVVHHLCTPPAGLPSKKKPRAFFFLAPHWFFFFQPWRFFFQRLKIFTTVVDSAAHTHTHTRTHTHAP
jgi:hypothetical protein